MIKVLFVCMGNICRSPTAEGVFTQMVNQAGLSKQIYIDSAGTHNYNVGNPPDLNSQIAAQKRGIDLSKLRARQLIQADLAEFDYILAMDQENQDILWSLCLPSQKPKLHLFLDFVPTLKTREVPDPYQGGYSGFEHVLDLIEAASEGLLAAIRKNYEL